MNKYKYIFTIILLGLISTWFISCDDEETYKPFYDAEEMQIAEYIANQPQLSELSELLEYTELKGLMSFYGTYTFFAPTNDALQAFYTKMGKQSYTDFDKTEIKQIVQNHIIGRTMLTTRTGEGSLPDTTLAGSNLVVTIEKEGEGLAFLLNKEAKIIERDIELPNGVVQIVDAVISVVDYSVAGWVKQQGAEFSIFNEALDKTGVYNVLDQKYTTLKDGTLSKNYYTLWAVPDAAFKAAGINSFDELAAKYNKNGQPVNSPTSSLYQYMQYHCVNKLLSLSEFDREATHVVTINNRLFQIEIDSEDALFKINREENGNFVGIDNDASNNNSNNGYVHILNKPLTEIKFKPVRRALAVCEKPEIPWWQMTLDGRVYNRYNWPSMNMEKIGIKPGAVSGIRFHPEAICYIDNHMCYWADDVLLFMVPPDDNNLIWYEFDLPPIAKGRYKVSVYHKGGPADRAVVQCYFNGERFGSIFDLRGGTFGMQTEDIGVLDVEASESNVMRFKELKSGFHFISEIIFTPVE